MTAEKNYRVYGFSGSMSFKAPCVVVTNVALTLSGEQTVNGVAVKVGDRVLVKDQSVTTENGIYDVQTSRWTRSIDFDGNLDAANGTVVVVVGALYQLSATNPVIIGTSALTFALL